VSLVIDLSGWVVLITGGTRGVGAGIAREFLHAGAEVETCGMRPAPELPMFEGKRPGYTAVDVRDPSGVADWVDAVRERHGRIDVAVNNAGGSPFAGFAEGSPNFHRRVAELNFLSAVWVSHAVYPVMAVQDQGGSIVNISSVSASRPSPGTAMYGAAKAALESLTRSLAVEWAPRIRVNAVRSGLVDTEGAIDHYGSPEQYAAVAATIPLGRFIRPAEVGAACVMLASPLAAHITGAVLDAHGGGEWPAFLQHTPNASFITDRSRE